MKSITISLNSIDRVKGFVNIISRYDGEFDLASDRYVVDAKSIMGIFSLDLSKNLRLDLHTDSANTEKLLAELQAFVVA